MERSQVDYSESEELKFYQQLIRSLPHLKEWRLQVGLIRYSFPWSILEFLFLVFADYPVQQLYCVLFLVLAVSSFSLSVSSPLHSSKHSFSIRLAAAFAGFCRKRRGGVDASSNTVRFYRRGAFSSNSSISSSQSAFITPVCGLGSVPCTA